MLDFKADLHCHSTCSDGTLTPEQLAERAKANGVTLWALTDHDEISGQQRAAQAAQKLQLDHLGGVEISVTFIDQTVHIVGLGIDPNNAALCAGLADTREGRNRRAQAIGDALAKVGLNGAYEGAAALADNPRMISRTHFARWLVAQGVCHNTHEVFQRYMTPGKPGYVPQQWATLRNAVEWIRGAGGIAVIAHPARYKFSANQEWALFEEFKALGGRGVEVLTGSHNATEAERYAGWAREHSLLASCGSDFHSPTESRIDLGGLPALQAGLTPVWSELEARIQRG